MLHTYEVPTTVKIHYIPEPEPALQKLSLENVEIPSHADLQVETFHPYRFLPDLVRSSLLVAIFIAIALVLFCYRHSIQSCFKGFCPKRRPPPEDNPLDEPPAYQMQPDDTKPDQTTQVKKHKRAKSMSNLAIENLQNTLKESIQSLRESITNLTRSKSTPDVSQLQLEVPVETTYVPQAPVDNPITAECEQREQIRLYYQPPNSILKPQKVLFSSDTKHD